jgi:hypothetical protein
MVIRSLGLASKASLRGNYLQGTSLNRLGRASLTSGGCARRRPASLGSVKSETAAVRSEIIYYATYMEPAVFAPTYFRV